MLRIGSSLQHCPRVFHFNDRCAASIQCGTRALSTSTCDSEKVSRRISALSRLINRLRLPRVSSINVGGSTIELPAEHVRVEGVNYTPEEIQYLGGFFDSSGHIHLDGTGGSMELEQTSARPQGLLLFRRILGGRLSLKSRGQKQAIRWTLSGQPELSRAASLLRETSRAKQQHFAELAAQLDDPEKNKAKATSTSPITWAYISGFFDSGGCIHIQSRRPHLVVSMSRKTPEILVDLQYMMRRDFPEWNLEEPTRKTNSYFTLRIREDDAARGVLNKLLENNLLVRRAAAEFALTTNKENHHENREEMSKFLSDHGRYHRLSEEGVERAKRITAVRMNVNRLKKYEKPEYAVALEELQELKKQHDEQLAVEKLARLRSDIRKLMRRGAAVE